MANPANVAGMARFGINPAAALGVSMPALRRMARSLGRDHDLALALWDSGVHEARILASLVDDPARVTAAQAGRWARDFDSWDVCDQVCLNLFGRTPWARGKALAWSRRRAEFVRRAGFALMAVLAVHDKAADDDAFRPMLGAVRRAAGDDRNFVRKAVNWALRQIGKRNAALRTEAAAVARDLAARPERSARWIGRDALRELESPKVLARVKAKPQPASKSVRKE
jgi:3-methyladenine DNA glycosylase AlkD